MGVGWTEGAAIGLPDGIVVGTAEGLPGVTVGKTVGAGIGLPDGAALGTLEGPDVGFYGWIC
jgi:hypothetical protein